MTAGFALMRGRLAEGRRWIRELTVTDSMTGRTSALLAEQVELASLEAWELEQPEKAVARLEAALAKHPLAAIPATDQPLFSRLWCSDAMMPLTLFFSCARHAETMP